MSLNLSGDVHWLCLDSESHESRRRKQEISAGSVKRPKRSTNTKTISTENRLWRCLEIGIGRNRLSVAVASILNLSLFPF